MKETLFYQAENARTGDVIPKYIDGTYQIFYLKGWKDRSLPGVVPGWHRMESTDLVHFSAEAPGVRRSGRHHSPRGCPAGGCDFAGGRGNGQRLLSV